MTPRQTMRGAKGQSILEFTIVLPLILLLLLGSVEVGYLVLDQQAVTRMTREGSNLISRNVTIADAATAMRTMAVRPVDFTTDSKIIFSVVKRGATAGTANYDKLFLYQRYQYGVFPASSKLQNSGGSFGGAPDYEAINPDTNAALRITNLPLTLVPVRGGLVYVTELFNRHQLIAPFDRLGVGLPETLYSIAYF